MNVKTASMTEREIDIIEAAFALFLRYGVKRTSMSDIAAEARISRQTLYNAFSDKDDVLRATIRLFTKRAMAAIEIGLATAETLDEKLDVVFEQLAVRPFETLRASPNAEDIILGINTASRDEIAENDRAFQAVLERIFDERRMALARAGLTPRALAEVNQIAVAAAKTRATDRGHLDALLAAQKAVVLSVAGDAED